MLIRFNISNFLSFNEETEFNMLAANSLRTYKEHIYTINKNLNVLKASAIYGANGAGKSNLIKGINSLQEIVGDGYIPKKVVSKKNKLILGAKERPITHEIEFSIGKNVYSYGIIFDSNLCLEEWLYKTGGKDAKMIFERKYSKDKKQPVIKLSEKYLKSAKSKLLISLMEENLLKNNELLISKNENLKIKEISDVLYWFDKCLVIIYPETRSASIFNNNYSNSNFKKFSENLLQTFNLGIDNLALLNEDFETFLSRENFIEKEDIEEIKNGLDDGHIYVFEGNKFTVSVAKENEKYIVKRVVASHKIDGKDILFEIKEESDGTQRLLDFVPMINSLLNNEKTYIIDEIDRSLHPALLHALIKKVMNDETTKGQIVFTTHESSLLSCKIFRADEIWFAEKDKQTQSTQLYTLNEFKPRNDLDIEKGYLNGRFGAIPFLSKLEDLNWNEDGI